MAESLLELLNKPAVSRTPASRAAALLGGGEMAAFAGLTLGGLIYDRMSIDPLALEAFQFANKATAGDIHKLASWASDTLTGSEATVQGRINRLQGYVFERLAASALRQGGAVVALPDSACNPGWDLMVNGVMVQAKCTASPDIVLEHFSKHVGITRVVVPEDLAEHFANDDRVMALGGLTRDLVRDQTSESLDAAADMVRLSLVKFAPTLSIMRNGWALWREETDFRSAVGNIAVDGTTRFVGAMAGKAAGAALAGALGGWPTILAPVVASSLGFRGGMALSVLLKRHVLLRREVERLDAAIRGWCAGAARKLGAMLDQAGRADPRFKAARERAGADWTPMIDDWLDRLEAEQAYRLHARARFDRAAMGEDVFDGETPLERAGAAMLAASRAGILPEDLAAERGALLVATEGYALGLKRRLLA